MPFIFSSLPRTALLLTACGSFLLYSCASSTTTSRSTAVTETSDTIARIPERIGANRRLGNHSERISLQDTSTTSPIVLTTGEVKREYDEMALIGANTYLYGMPATLQELNEILRAEAREMGANAIVRIQYYFVGRGNLLYALGTAVKYK